ncbi:uncharacterized protein LOC142049940 [Phalacrocorax aristotelis]|uniref:uncharacterized protein LOC142049940 n=1 Tax=Phalacrocorax aristotelis TaxID=126867 RepID=UPI003F4C6F02
MAAAPPPVLPVPRLLSALEAGAPAGSPLVPAGSGGRRPTGGAAGAAARCEACGEASCPAPTAARRPCPRGVPGGGGAAGAPQLSRTAGPAPPVAGERYGAPGGARTAPARLHVTGVCWLVVCKRCSASPYKRCLESLNVELASRVRPWSPFSERWAAAASAEERSSGRGARPPRCSLVAVPVQRGCSSLLGSASSSGAHAGLEKVLLVMWRPEHRRRLEIRDLNMAHLPCDFTDDGSQFSKSLY